MTAPMNGLQEPMEALAREREVNDSPKGNALLPLPAAHREMGSPSCRLYTAEQMHEYALANAKARTVAWHFQRPPSSNGMFGLNWPEVNRIITEETKAAHAATTIDQESPGSLTPLNTDGLVSVLRKALIRASSMELQCLITGTEDEPQQLKNALAGLWRELEATRALNDVAIKALTEISNIEDKVNGGDWDEIEEARSIAISALGVCQAPIESSAPNAPA
ncbi:hypothetical protein [Pseudomonas sp. PLMAX]|uniref:hypothetical protein n=1 Tax=Pseudomonas sp. PLMAX TaxID=2201998 RepID=UPI0038BC26D5